MQLTHLFEDNLKTFIRTRVQIIYEAGWMGR